jgi:hypothetical protein
VEALITSADVRLGNWLHCRSKSPRRGVNRQNLKFTNFKHALCPGLVLEIVRRAKDSSPCYELLNQCG